MPAMNSNEKPKREIRSYVLRQGRMTVSQARARAVTWPLYGIEPSEQPITSASYFSCEQPLTIEIGFGMGESLLAMAAAHPERNFLGIEVHGPGIGAVLAGIEKNSLKNLRVMQHDAVDILEKQIAPASVDTFQVFFPDPWHKKRHHKRRLIQPDFVRLLVSRLKMGGHLHLATDWAPYAEQMMDVLSAEATLSNTVSAGAYVVGQELRPETKFERRGKRLGHEIFDLYFVKNSR